MDLNYYGHPISPIYSPSTDKYYSRADMTQSTQASSFSYYPNYAQNNWTPPICEYNNSYYTHSNSSPYNYYYTPSSIDYSNNQTLSTSGYLTLNQQNSIQSSYSYTSNSSFDLSTNFDYVNHNSSNTSIQSMQYEGVITFLLLFYS